MNKRRFLLPTMFLALISLVYTGCKDDEDTTAPIITLNGSAATEIDLQEAYTEAGATAVDDEDGAIAVSISGVVDNDLKGDYTITYSATDAAGNTATAERTVTVVNSADFMGGNYVNAEDVSAASGTVNFDATVNISNTDNGVFTVENFGAFGNSVVVACEYNSTTDKITASVPQSLGGGANLTTVFNSSGVTSTSPVIFVISYQWIDSGGATDISTSTYTK
ncbi:MAG: DUF5011 domain-containing protein [Bacteroidetes bacterium]|nr:DUF5011 domain-containing protein [Bacteroidota bacterium]